MARTEPRTQNKGICDTFAAYEEQCALNDELREKNHQLECAVVNANAKRLNAEQAARKAEELLETLWNLRDLEAMVFKSVDTWRTERQFMREHQKRQEAQS